MDCKQLAHHNGASLYCLMSLVRLQPAQLDSHGVGQVGECQLPQQYCQPSGPLIHPAAEHRLMAPAALAHTAGRIGISTVMILRQECSITKPLLACSNHVWHQQHQEFVRLRSWGGQLARQQTLSTIHSLMPALQNVSTCSSKHSAHLSSSSRAAPSGKSASLLRVSMPPAPPTPDIWFTLTAVARFVSRYITG